MDKKSKNLYTISMIIFGLAAIFGASVLIWTNFIAENTQSLSFQTCYLLILLGGILGIGSSLKNIAGRDSLKARKISIGYHIITLVSCAAWLFVLYFLNDNPDAFSQMATWLLTAATVNKLITIQTGRKNS